MICRISVPLELELELPDDTTIAEAKELLGEQFDALLESTDFLSDAWKASVVELVK